MAYKYEVEEKAKQLRVRVLIAIYILFVISAAIIGVSVRLQQIRNIQPSRPGAADVGQSGYTLASDPTYNPRNLMAFAYCAEVNTSGQETGNYIPLNNVRFFFQQVGKRDVTQIRNDRTLAQLCTNVPAGCTLRGQTAAQCSSSLTSCGATDGVPGIICPGGEDIRTTGSDGLVYWPGSSQQGTILGDLRWDDNQVDVTIDTDYGILDQGEVTYNSTTYTINKSSAVLNSPSFTPDLNSLLPYYRWQCQGQCSSPNACTVDGQTYSASPCTFSGNVFNCPQNKYITYAGAPPASDATDDSFLYSRQAAARNATNPTKVSVGFGYEGIVDASYPTVSSTAANDLVAFKGNLVKFRFTCLAQAVTTPTPTITPSVTVTTTVTTTPSVTPTPTEYLLDASKTGPACVERMSPNNLATFTITVRNQGTGATTINSVEDALPQGFTYTAGTTLVNGAAVADTFVTTVNVGSSQKITFAPPSGQSAWNLASGQALTIRFTSTAGSNAITGTNTNQVVVNPEGRAAIDNITFSFEVAQTCVPVTGVFDDPRVIIAVSAVLIIFAMYLMYNPQALGFLEKAYSRLEKTKVSVDKTAARLEKKASIRGRFEEKMRKNLSKKRK